MIFNKLKKMCREINGNMPSNEQKLNNDSSKTFYNPMITENC